LEVLEVPLPALLLKKEMVEPTFTALSRQQLEELVFDVAKAAIKAALKEIPKQEPTEREPREPAFLTKKQAANKLSCSPSTIDNAARAGRLKRHYIGKGVRFKLEEVLALAKPVNE
jgi:excisionase family DNA binding protein